MCLVGRAAGTALPAYGTWPRLPHIGGASHFRTIRGNIYRAEASAQNAIELPRQGLFVARAKLTRIDGRLEIAGYATDHLDNL